MYCSFSILFIQITNVYSKKWHRIQSYTIVSNSSNSLEGDYAEQCLSCSNRNPPKYGTYPCPFKNTTVNDKAVHRNWFVSVVLYEFFMFNYLKSIDDILEFSIFYWNGTWRNVMFRCFPVNTIIIIYSLKTINTWTPLWQ